jgi:hypothetical protein
MQKAPHLEGPGVNLYIHLNPLPSDLLVQNDDAIE